MPNPYKQRVENYYNKSCKVALRYVEKLARRVLNENPHLDEFIMSMGGAFFTEKESNRTYSIHEDSESPDYRLTEFINEWDEYLKLSGNPMRFTAKGEKITEW